MTTFTHTRSERQAASLRGRGQVVTMNDTCRDEWAATYAIAPLTQVPFGFHAGVNGTKHTGRPREAGM